MSTKSSIKLKIGRKHPGFTLIEVLVVIVILGIMAALAIPAVASYLKNSKAQTNLANAKTIYNAGHAYLAAYPDLGLAGATMTNLIDGNYLQDKLTTAEGNDYIINTTGSDLLITWDAETDVPDEDPDLDGTGEFPQ